MAKAASKRNLEPRWPQIAPKTAPKPSQTPPDVDFSYIWGLFLLMFFGCFSAAGLSKRIVQKGTGDGGDSPQGVLDNNITETVFCRQGHGKWGGQSRDVEHELERLCMHGLLSVLKPSNHCPL